MDGTTVGSVTDGTYGSGQVGIGTSQGETAQFDNLRVGNSTVPSPSPTSPSPTSPSPTSPSPTTSPAGTCRVAFTPNAWQTGFTVNVTITNGSSAGINGWTLRFALPSGQAVTGAWHAPLTGTTGTVTATNLSYNGSVPAGGSTQFGFQGTLTGSYAPPTAPVLNGTPCTSG